METLLNDAEFDVLMTGEEDYPCLVTPNSTGWGRIVGLSKIIQEQFKGIPMYAGCLEKAKIVQGYIGGTILTGAMRVASEGPLNFSLSFYGFDFNPPLECHCWNYQYNRVIDFSLPGVILRGSKSEDEYGPFLVGRKPVIHVGCNVDWLLYRPHGVVS